MPWKVSETASIWLFVGSFMRIYIQISRHAVKSLKPGSGLFAMFGQNLCEALSPLTLKVFELNAVWIQISQFRSQLGGDRSVGVRVLLYYYILKVLPSMHNTCEKGSRPGPVRASERFGPSQ